MKIQRYSSLDVMFYPFMNQTDPANDDAAFVHVWSKDGEMDAHIDCDVWGQHLSADQIGQLAGDLNLFKKEAYRQQRFLWRHLPPETRTTGESITPIDADLLSYVIARRNDKYHIGDVKEWMIAQGWDGQAAHMRVLGMVGNYLDLAVDFSLHYIER